MSPARGPSEAEIIFNKANVALARSQRLIASWLPPRTAEEVANAKSEEDLEREDREMFAPVPELLGVGAPLPKEIAEGSLYRRRLTTNDKLLQQLIGKKAAKDRLQAAKRPSSLRTHSVPNPAKDIKPANADEDSDDEKGRASAFRSKRTKAKPHDQHSSLLNDENTSQRRIKAMESLNSEGRPPRDSDDEGLRPKQKIPAKSESQRSQTNSGSSKRAVSFLDEILGERRKKRKRKK